MEIVQSLHGQRASYADTASFELPPSSAACMRDFPMFTLVLSEQHRIDVTSLGGQREKYRSLGM
jgi:hypothetical protein